MLDANVLFSALLSKTSITARMVGYIKDNHTIVICLYALEEVVRGFHKKFPEKVQNMHEDLGLLPYEFVHFNNFDQTKYPIIKDIDDLPILANAIEAGVDILITGDTDFDDVEIDKPRIMKPRQFLDEYMMV